MQLLKILSGLTIAGIIALSFFSWYSADDLCNLNELARYSVPKMMWLQYLNWDGRSLSIAALVQLTLLKNFPPEVAAFCWACSFVTAGIMIFKVIRLENPIAFSKEINLIATGLICGTLWLGMWKLLPDIIYWPTGGSYSFMNLIGLIWLYVFISHLKKNRFTRSSNWFMLIFSFACGMNSHNFIVALILIVLIEAGFYWYVNRNYDAMTYCFYSFAGLLVAACIVFFAPGNHTRLSSDAYPGMSFNIFYFYFLVLAKYLYWLFSLIVLCLIATWLTAKNFYFEKRIIRLQLKKLLTADRNKKSMFIMIHRHKYLLAALVTVTVFSPIAYFATPRTGIFFGTFLVIYLFQQGWKKGWNISTKKFKYGSIFFLIVCIAVILYQCLKANEIKKQLAERESIYNRSRGEDVAVSAVSKNKIPFAFLFVDISSDSSYWVNRCVAQYYALKTVRTIPDE